MGLKTNLVISLIFVALLGFVYFHEIRGGQQRQDEAERSRRLLDFSDHEARRLTIDRGDTVTVLERVEDSWRLTGPVATGADQQAVERYLRNLRETEVEGDPLQDSAAVAADAGRLADYGLERPRLRVAPRACRGVGGRLRHPALRRRHPYRALHLPAAVR